jgi:D-glycero-alpha-D-manno-heptose-7-phosphate kinase
MIIVKSPYRVSFFGGGSDYHTWYQQYGGCVLSTSIDKYCFINVKKISPFFDYKHRVVWSEIEEVESVNKIRHPIVREVYRKYGFDKYYTSLHHDGDMPARSGIGSSSAFACAMIAAARSMQGINYDKYELAKEAIYIEREVLGEAVGVQDQIASAFGGFNKININTDGSFVVKPIKRDHIQELESHLLMFYTGIQRSASEVARVQIDTSPQAKIAEITQMMQIANQGEQIMLSSNFDYKAFGGLLHESWMLKRGLTSKITNDTIDDIYSTALNKGAIGGKLLGAGSGGFVLIFAKPDVHSQIRSSLADLIEIPFKFETDGTKVILAS